MKAKTARGIAGVAQYVVNFCGGFGAELTWNTYVAALEETSLSTAFGMIPSDSSDRRGRPRVSAPNLDG